MLALVVLVLALAAIAILGTVLLTRTNHPKSSPDDPVRHTIDSSEVAVQRDHPVVFGVDQVGFRGRVGCA